MGNPGTSPDIPLETFSKVVEAVYDCALDPTRWNSTVRMIGEMSASQICFIGVHDYSHSCSELMIQWGCDERFVRLHEEKYKLMDPFFYAGQLAPVGRVMTQAMLVDEEKFKDSRFYKEWYILQGLHDMIGFKVLQTGQRIGWLVANRREQFPRYGNDEVRLLTLLSAHICRSIALSDALNLKTIRSEALEATLNSLAAGVFLADRCGRVIYMNWAAERQARIGNVLRVEHGHILPVNRLARSAMGHAIAEAIADDADTPSSGITLALPDGEGAGLVASVLPLGHGECPKLCGAFAAMAAIFVQDPIAVPQFPGEAFAKIYGLTGSELRVLLAMSPGLSTKEAAEVLGISQATAKTHLQHIFAKTGTSKQSALMHLFMSCAPPVKAA